MKKIEHQEEYLGLKNCPNQPNGLRKMTLEMLYIDLGWNFNYIDKQLDFKKGRTKELGKLYKIKRARTQAEAINNY